VLTLPMPAGLLLASLCVVFAAGIVRGFAGFGFSALCVAALSLFMPPAQVVPPIFVLEVLASLTLLRSACKDVDWRWLGWLVAGNALCIPLGVALLAYVDETPLRLLIGALLLAVAVLLSSSALAPAAMRATMILLFLFTDLYALAWAAVLPGAAGQELLGAPTLQLALWLAPAMLAGIWVGQRAFAGVSSEAFRRQVLNLLMLIAGSSVLRAAWALLR
jgi:uncharacterized membrane protein YfcA